MTDVLPAGSSADFNARKNRWREFLKPGARPGFMFFVSYDDAEGKAALPPPPKEGWRGRHREAVEYKWQVYQRSCWRAAQVHDDWVPYLNMGTGTEIFAEAFGCPVYRSDQSKFTVPLIHSAGEVSAIKVPELSRSSLAYVFDIADELQQRAGRDAPFHMVDVQSPMDISALIWEKVEFYVGMAESPRAVRELASKVTQYLMSFFDEWFRRYGTDYVAHFPDYFISGGVTLSEDEVGTVSEDMFLDLFLPELEALSNRYGGLGMHCCADARHQWKHFRKIPNLKLLNLVNPPVRKPEVYIKDAYEYFADVCAQFHMGWKPDGPAETWPVQYPSDARVVFGIQAANLAEAQAVADKMQALRASL